MRAGPTTSHPRGSSGNRAADPLRGIKVKVRLVAPNWKELAALASSKGLAVEEGGGAVSVEIYAATPEEALSQLEVLGGIVSSRA